MNAMTMLSPYRHTGQWLEWRRGEHNGNWYWCPEICPALFRYFEAALAELYVKVEGRK